MAKKQKNVKECVVILEKTKKKNLSEAEKSRRDEAGKKLLSLMGITSRRKCSGTDPVI